ncbi:MAG TPA: hypothetical protein PLV25_03570, partial [Opitutales bacterium]|nr:hypothetical protein [Opitutales bacterium]
DGLAGAGGTGAGSVIAPTISWIVNTAMSKDCASAQSPDKCTSDAVYWSSMAGVMSFAVSVVAPVAVSVAHHLYEHCTSPRLVSHV